MYITSRYELFYLMWNGIILATGRTEIKDFSEQNAEENMRKQVI
jgi:low affinity Fe/Cu permease